MRGERRSKWKRKRERVHLDHTVLKLWAQHPDLALTTGAAEPVWLLTRVRRGETSVVLRMQSLRRCLLSGSWTCRAGTWK